MVKHIYEIEKLCLTEKHILGKHTYFVGLTWICQVDLNFSGLTWMDKTINILGIKTDQNCLKE